MKFEDLKKYDSDEYEIRIWYEYSLMVNEYDFKMIKFDIEMKQHFQLEKEKHEDLINVLKLKSWYEFWK